MCQLATVANKRLRKTHRYKPWADVGGALIEAQVLPHPLLASRRQGYIAMVPIEIMPYGLDVKVFGDLFSATGTILPCRTLMKV